MADLAPAKVAGLLPRDIAHLLAACPSAVQFLVVSRLSNILGELERRGVTLDPVQLDAVLYATVIELVAMSELLLGLEEVEA